MKVDRHLQRLERQLKKRIRESQASDKVNGVFEAPGFERFYITRSGRRLSQEEFDKEKPEFDRRVLIWDIPIPERFARHHRDILKPTGDSLDNDVDSLLVKDIVVEDLKDISDPASVTRACLL